MVRCGNQVCGRTQSTSSCSYAAPGAVVGGSCTVKARVGRGACLAQMRGDVPPHGRGVRAGSAHQHRKRELTNHSRKRPGRRDPRCSALLPCLIHGSIAVYGGESCGSALYFNSGPVGTGRAPFGSGSATGLKPRRRGASTQVPASAPRPPSAFGRLPGRCHSAAVVRGHASALRPTGRSPRTQKQAREKPAVAAGPGRMPVRPGSGGPARGGSCEPETSVPPRSWGCSP